MLQALDAGVDIPGFAADLAISYPTLFSNVPVFIAQDMMEAMKSVIAAPEAAAKLEGFQAAAMT